MPSSSTSATNTPRGRNRAAQKQGTNAASATTRRPRGRRMLDQDAIERAAKRDLEKKQQAAAAAAANIQKGGLRPTSPPKTATAARRRRSSHIKSPHKAYVLGELETSSDEEIDDDEDFLGETIGSDDDLELYMDPEARARQRRRQGAYVQDNRNEDDWTDNEEETSDDDEDTFGEDDSEEEEIIEYSDESEEATSSSDEESAQSPSQRRTSIFQRLRQSQSPATERRRSQSQSRSQSMSPGHASKAAAAASSANRSRRSSIFQRFARSTSPTSRPHRRPHSSSTNNSSSSLPGGTSHSGRRASRQGAHHMHLVSPGGRGARERTFSITSSGSGPGRRRESASSHGGGKDDLDIATVSLDAPTTPLTGRTSIFQRLKQTATQSPLSKIRTFGGGINGASGDPKSPRRGRARSVDIASRQRVVAAGNNQSHQHHHSRHVAPRRRSIGAAELAAAASAAAGGPGVVLRRLSVGVDGLKKKLDQLGVSNHGPPSDGAGRAGRRPAPKFLEDEDFDWDENRELSREETLYLEQMYNEIETLDL